jgi:hypothetical protein
MMLSNVAIILYEEKVGAFATGHYGMVVAANAAWVLFPLAMIWRMRRDGPFLAHAPVPRAAELREAAEPAT